MNTANAKSQDNFDQAELDKFGALANRWWDPQGPQKPLHALNPVRLDYVRQRVKLRDAVVLDVGCGAGLLSEALAGAGASVTATDLAPELIQVAKLHRLESKVEVEYLLQSVESLAEQRAGSFDAITCMEMLEHVPDPGAIIAACATLLKPGGKLFLSTLNRTPAAFALAIVGAEYVLGWLPKGTHQWEKFVTPEELEAAIGDGGLTVEDRTGVVYNPLSGAWSLSRDMGVNYMLVASSPASSA